MINTVLNINDSNTAEVLKDFNVSKDEILRRISALQPVIVNNVSTSVNANASENDEANTTNATGEDADKRE